jgi:hypothetical protein
MVGHGLGRPLAAPVQGAIMVVQPGVAPGRFRMPQEKQGLHGLIRGKSL